MIILKPFSFEELVERLKFISRAPKEVDILYLLDTLPSIYNKHQVLANGEG
jgi:DNA-binding response OmpR family regulator